MRKFFSIVFLSMLSLASMDLSGASRGFSECNQIRIEQSDGCYLSADYLCVQNQYENAEFVFVKPDFVFVEYDFAGCFNLDKVNCNETFGLCSRNDLLIKPPITHISRFNPTHFLYTGNNVLFIK